MNKQERNQKMYELYMSSNLTCRGVAKKFNLGHYHTMEIIRLKKKENEVQKFKLGELSEQDVINSFIETRCIWATHRKLNVSRDYIAKIVRKHGYGHLIKIKGYKLTKSEASKRDQKLFEYWINNKASYRKIAKEFNLSHSYVGVVIAKLKKKTGYIKEKQISTNTEVEFDKNAFAY
jgi:transposase